MRMLIVYVVTLVVFTGVDFVWLGVMGNAFYRPAMGDMAAPDFRIAPAVVFYLLFAVGVVYFAVRPADSLGRGGDAWRAVGARRLRRLRSHQSGDAEDVAAVADAGRYGLGHAADRLRRRGGLCRRALLRS